MICWFFLFWHYFDLVKRVKFGVSGHFHKGNGLKFCMLMYPDHLQNWLAYGYSLLIFLILVLFWLSEMGQIWGFRAFWSCSWCWPFDWNWSYLGFLGIIWRTCVSKCRGGRRHISDVMRQVLSSLYLFVPHIILLRPNRQKSWFCKM